MVFLVRTVSLQVNFQRATVSTAAGMDTSNRKALLLALVLILSCFSCEAYSVPECCRQPSQSCRLYMFLCRSGGKAVGATLTGDASAGILTLGKRSEEEYRLQSRLHQLLNGHRNQAAGILTMGKRTVERDWMEQAGISTTLPV